MSTDQTSERPDFIDDEAVRTQLRDRLEACKADREVLRAEVAKSITDTFKEGLSCLEDALPTSGVSEAEAAANRRLFGILRRRLLDRGNACVRDLDPLLGSYVVEQVMVRHVHRTVMPRHGEYGLPVGVEMPPRHSK
jgi:hypothetical protein